MLTIEYSQNGGTHLRAARHLTEDEKRGYAEWCRETVLICTGESIDLPHITWKDVPQRPQDGSFPGGGNWAWIISDEEHAHYIALNGQREREAQEKEIQQDRKMNKEILRQAGKQEKLYTPEEAKEKSRRWNDVYNEGGYGFVPHYYTVEEVRQAEEWLAAHPET